MKIEQASLCDAEKILELQKVSYKSEAELYDDFTIPPMVQTIRDMRDDFTQQKFLKAVENGKIIGSVRAHEKDGTCHIGRLMVHPDFQNQGIGTKLVGEIENVFKECRRFELFTGNKSEKNLVLYQKLGYKKFKEQRINDQVSLVYLEKVSD